MKQATTRKNEEIWSGAIKQRLKETLFILLCSLSIYFFIALFTYHEADPAWSRSGTTPEIHNAAGKAGAWFSDVLFSLFGYMAYFWPIVLGIGGLFVYRTPVALSSPAWLWLVRAIGGIFTLGSSCGFIALHLSGITESLPMDVGGLLGNAIETVSVHFLNTMGATVILIALFLTGITLLTGFSWIKLVDIISNRTKLRAPTFKVPSMAFAQHYWNWLKSRKLPSLSLLLPSPKTAGAMDAPSDFFTPISEEQSLAVLLDEPLPPIKAWKKPEIKPVAEKSTFGAVKKLKVTTEKTPEKYYEKSLPEKKSIFKKGDPHATPSLQLLDKSEKPTARQGYTSAQLQELSRLVEMRLLEFGVEAKVVGVYPGPVITRFELDLAAGIKVNKITTLAKDLARSLSVISVRVVEVIPGKSVVGLEIPNVHRELVRLKEVLEDPTYQQALSPLSLALGKDIAGRPVVVDLAKMPHLLVAGTTGAGKSVGINAMLLSILYKATPQDVRMILIDPKMLELAIYDNIPHLLTPVVTDMKDAANALRWCVAEMERRYQIMAAIGVRNLSGYNQKVIDAAKSGEPLLDPLLDPRLQQEPLPLEELPFIVVVVDEFADMMMVVGKKVEELIARIAQKARAAGIHLILATQRPSVDVITGLIKANIPTRISYQVSSRIDSRTILDQSGAEQLLGHGDMLYLPPGVGVPFRIHGAFVSDEEVHKVVKALRAMGRPEYIESVVQSSLPNSFMDGDEDSDELYDQAVAIVTESRKGSISLVQRRLKIGYNRAARLVERMEAEGVVSALQSNGTREVLAPPPIQ